MAKKDIDKDIAEIEEKIESAKTPKVKDAATEMVTLQIPISESEEDDWVCIINGHSYQIKRGVNVIVPRAVKEVYENQQNQLLAYRKAIKKLQDASKDQLAFQ